MDNEKSSGAAMTSAAGETVAEDAVTRHPWQKPTVTRIDMKRTLVGGGSAPDGFDGTPP